MIFEKQRAFMHDALGIKYKVKSSKDHLVKTVKWLCKAQDVTPDDGVARMYKLGAHWGASYPETTGYIIPTFLQYGKYFNDSVIITRAHNMTKWLQEIQHTTGYIQGGTIADEPSPAIFNTGQVLFGYCAAYEAFGDESISASAKKAAGYLLSQQDSDGQWRRNLSKFCTPNLEYFSYNIRTAWALYRAAKIFKDSEYEHSAMLNFEAILNSADDSGWIAKNCLTTENEPLLHTIAYTLQGLLEISDLSGSIDKLKTVIVANNNLLLSFQKKKSLFGRYDKNWIPVVKWRCLTGEAQIACIWFRLYTLTGDLVWKNNAVILLNMIKQTQCLNSGDDNIDGGIKGSYPVFGDYGKYEYVNWAAKFFVDALMLEIGFDRSSTKG